MQTITSTQAARTFSEILNKVYYQQKSYEIKRGKQVIAKIVPSASGIKVNELKDFFDRLPKLDDDDNFEQDLKSIRKTMKSEKSLWD